MEMYNKKIKTIVIITLTIVTIMLLVMIRGKKEENVIKESMMINEYNSNSEAEVAVYYPLSTMKDGVSDIFIRWWENPYEENKCYLYLPTGVKGKTLLWKLQSETSVWINQESIQDGMEFELIEGLHEVEIEKDGEMLYKIMEVRYSSAIPSIFLETESGNMDYVHEKKKNEERGNYTILDGDGVLVNGGRLERICGRGNVSWYKTEKKAYEIKLETESEVLSMEADKHWVLNPNYSDKSLLRNKICLDLAEGMELGYVPDSRYMDVYINGNYRGNYLLMEKVEVSENRLDIRNLEKETEILNTTPVEKLGRFVKFGIDGVSAWKGIDIKKQPENLAGGYLLELDLEKRYNGEPSGFITTRNQRVVIKSPKYASREQVMYISKFYQEFEDAVFSENGVCDATGKHYSEYIDVDSFVKMYLIEEISKNIDTSVTSQYMYQVVTPQGEKFYAGPPWDYDKSLGYDGKNGGGIELRPPQDIHAGVKKHESDIWYALYQQQDFRKNVIQEFEENMCLLIKREIEEVVPEMVEGMRASAEMNIIRWHLAQDKTIEDRIASYERDIRKRIEFLNERMEFLKSEWKIK